MPHHIGHCCINVIQGHCYTTAFQWPYINHPCSNVATRMVEAQGYPGLVAKAGER
jgi:hypothetical protein